MNTVSVPSDTWTEIAPGVSFMQTTGETLQARVAPTGEVQVFQNSMPVESTAHFEAEEDQEAAYRDEPTIVAVNRWLEQELTDRGMLPVPYKAGDVVDVSAFTPIAHRCEGCS